MHEPPAPCAVSPLTLSELTALFLQHAASWYRRRDGTPTREHLNYRATLDRFTNFAGKDSSPAKINRHQVRAWLDQLAAEDLTRSYINSCLGRLRRFVRWSVDLDYINNAPLAELALVRPLAPFRSKAAEPPPPTPPPLAVIEQIERRLPRHARDIIHLSRLTGCRPSELLELSNAEVHIDNNPRLTPLQHKTAHHGHQRVIPLTAIAVAIVERYWRPFLPQDKLFTGSRRSKKGNYTIDALRALIHRHCTAAGVQHWTPYDVRRAVARKVRRERGLDAAQALLGHANASTTEIYAPLEAGSDEHFEAARRAQEVL